MPPAFQIRPAAPGERPALADLWVASWAATLPEIDFEARRSWFDGHMDRLVDAGAETHVAVDPASGAAAGFVVIHPGTGYLDQLAVAPGFWGRGAAQALLAAARLRAPSGVALDVNQDNPRAIAFYRAEGFRITAEGANPLSGRLTYRMEWTPA